MDSKFVISQIVTAVITIVTTTIVVRLSLKGTLGINEKYKSKLKSLAIIGIAISVLLLILTVSIWKLWQLVSQSPESPITRMEVWQISILSFLTCLYALSFGYFLFQLGDWIVRRIRNSGVQH